MVSPKTVSNHVEHVYAKIGVSSRAAATLYATQQGLVGSYEPGGAHEEVSDLAPEDGVKSS